MEFHAYKEGNSGKENHQTLNQYGLLLFRANGLFFIFYARIRHTRCWLARLPTRRKDLERGNKSLKEKYSLSVEEHTNQTGTLSQVWMELLKGVVISPLFFFSNMIFLRLVHINIICDLFSKGTISLKFCRQVQWCKMKLQL